MCMEYLAWLIQGEVEDGNWKGVKTSRQGPTFSHIFFADDLVLFAKATKTNCNTIKKVLHTFCSASGQKININKSKIFVPSSTPPNRIHLVEHELGFKVSTHFGKYLGVPILTDGRDHAAFDFIIEKIRGRLAGWKARSLSLAGRCILINSVTTAIPTHVMQCCILPKSTCNALDKLNRNFLWGDTVAKRKLHLINWGTITRPKAEGGLGIKRSYCRNKALLAKRLWDFSQGSTAPWALTLKAKYHELRSQVCQKSIVWKSINLAKPIVDKGKGTLIHNGHGTNFWMDNWLGSGPLRHRIEGPLNFHEESTKVCDLWDADSFWQLNRLSITLPLDIQQSIRASPKPLNPLQEDSTYWTPSTNGLFSTNSTYTIALDLDGPYKNTANWKWLWKLNCLPRVICFMWLLYHGRLPIKTLLVKRKIITDDLCPLCSSASETLLHAFRDCIKLQPIWLHFGAPQDPSFFSETSIQVWTHYWSKSSLPTPILSHLQWQDLFPILLWTIWSARNKTAMESNPFDPHQVIKRATSLTLESWIMSPRKTAIPKSNPTLIGWKPPPLSFIKLNTDGSVSGNPGQAGAGGVLRDHHGTWIGGFARNIGRTNSLAAELWALRDGLALAQNLNVQKLIVEMDAKVVIDMLSAVCISNLSNHPYSALIFDCRSMIQNFEEIVLQHTYREGNSTADLLAKAGTDILPSFSLFDSPPSFVLSQYMADIWGIQYPRMMQSCFY
jgi:ribonuclease HI